MDFNAFCHDQCQNQVLHVVEYQFKINSMLTFCGAPHIIGLYWTTDQSSVLRISLWSIVTFPVDETSLFLKKNQNNWDIFSCHNCFVHCFLTNLFSLMIFRNRALNNLNILTQVKKKNQSTNTAALIFPYISYMKDFTKQNIKSLLVFNKQYESIHKRNSSF